MASRLSRISRKVEGGRADPALRAHPRALHRREDALTAGKMQVRPTQNAAQPLNTHGSQAPSSGTAAAQRNTAASGRQCVARPSLKNTGPDDVWFELRADLGIWARAPSGEDGEDGGDDRRRPCEAADARAERYEPFFDISGDNNCNFRGKYG